MPIDIRPAVLRAAMIDSSSSTRRAVQCIALRSGDHIRIEGIPDGNDSVQILPEDN